MGIFGPDNGEAGKSKDPVCGRVVVEALAIGPEDGAQGAVWFCSIGCQAAYQENQSKEREANEAHRPLRRAPSRVADQEVEA